MPDPQLKAVFLSYAREDADVARRIADALRAFGVEVWFDMNELRGGDAWDQKIRKQIKDCALFIPIVSQQSDQRGEGYFRLEWKLAVERSHLLAEGRPFLVPVVVDDTTEADASVPESFLKAQWTRLPNGEPTPQFVEQVKRLLTAPIRTSGVARRPSAPPPPAVAAATPAPIPKKGFPVWAAALLAVMVIALAALVVFRPAVKSDATPVAVSAPPMSKAVDVVAPLPTDKSLAVLPFNNMSEEKDSAFFTDGIQEDILTNLALITGLRVVSRTSVMQYRNTTKTIRQIAQELGVTYLLEGSVRRSGKKVRVTGQLIRAANDEHVWAKAYDRDMSDIFAIQEELATEIAGALKTALTPQQKTIIEGRSTTSVDAYSAFLKARNIGFRTEVSRVTLPELDRLLDSSVRLDPNYVPAWVEMARVNFAAFRSLTTGGDRNRLAAAKTALDQAIRLAPKDPAVLRMRGQAAIVDDDRVAARAFYEQALQAAPGDAEVYVALGRLADEERLWAEAMVHHRKAQALDPRNPVVLWDAYGALLNLRQYEQARVVAQLLIELQPDAFEAKAALASLSFLANGSTREMDALYASLSPEELRAPNVIAWKFSWYYHQIGDAKAYVELCDAQGTDLNFSDEDSTLQYAEALIVLGQRERAVSLVRPVLERLTEKLKTDPKSDRLRGSLSYAQALSGDRAGAIQSIEVLLGTLKETDSVRRSNFIKANVGIVYAWLGEKDKAVDTLLPLMAMPVTATSSVYGLARDIDFFPLRGFPRWETLLADPANKKPFNY